MFLSSLYVALRAKHKIWADHRDVLSPDLFSHGSRSSTSVVICLNSLFTRVGNHFTLCCSRCGLLILKLRKTYKR